MRGRALGIAAVLGFAAIGKITAFEDSVASVSQTHLASPGLSGPIVVAVCCTEVIVALSLLCGVRGRAIAFLASALLFAAFAGYSAWRMWMGIHVPCSCFGLFLRLPSGAMAALSAILSHLSLSGWARLARPALTPMEVVDHA